MLGSPALESKFNVLAVDCVAPEPHLTAHPPHCCSLASPEASHYDGRLTLINGSVRSCWCVEVRRPIELDDRSFDSHRASIIPLIADQVSFCDDIGRSLYVYIYLHGRPYLRIYNICSYIVIRSIETRDRCRFRPTNSWIAVLKELQLRFNTRGKRLLNDLTFYCRTD